MPSLREGESQHCPGPRKGTRLLSSPPCPMHGRDLPPRGQLASAARDRISEKLLISRLVSTHPSAPATLCLSPEQLPPEQPLAASHHWDFPSPLLMEHVQLFLFQLITNCRRPGSKGGLLNAFTFSFLEGVFETGRGGCPGQLVCGVCFANKVFK